MKPMVCDIELTEVKFFLEIETIDEALVDNEIIQAGAILRDSRNFSFVLQDRNVSSLQEAQSKAWNSKEDILRVIHSLTAKEFAENGSKLMLVRPSSLADWRVTIHRAPSDLRNNYLYHQIPKR